MHQQTITFPTTDREQIVDITDMVKAVVAEHPDCCLCALYARARERAESDVCVREAVPA